MPFKYQTFALPPGHRDVVWVVKDGQLYRCTGVVGQVPCVAATFVGRASVVYPDEQGVAVGTAVSPLAAPAPTDLRPLQ